MPALGDNNKPVGRPSLEVWVGYGGEKASQNAPSQAPEVGGKLGKDAKGKNVEWLPGQDRPPASRLPTAAPPPPEGDFFNPDFPTSPLPEWPDAPGPPQTDASQPCSPGGAA